MRKEKKDVEYMDDTSYVDGTRFGYGEDVNVEISGQLFYALMRLVGKLANDEVKWQYQINPESLAETANPENVVNVISNEGITYFNFLGEMEMLHMQNIKSGLTLPIEEVQEAVQKKIADKLKELNGGEDSPNEVPETTLKVSKKRTKKTQ